jgi:hypothetical protein
MKPRCPICGDPRPFIFWVDEDPPEECPYGATTVTNCTYQMEEAKRQAHWRKICPEAFDANGNIIKGGLTMVMRKLHPEAFKEKQ